MASVDEHPYTAGPCPYSDARHKCESTFPHERKNLSIPVYGHSAIIGSLTQNQNIYSNITTSSISHLNMKREGRHYEGNDNDEPYSFISPISKTSIIAIS